MNSSALLSVMLWGFVGLAPLMLVALTQPRHTGIQFALYPVRSWLVTVGAAALGPFVVPVILFVFMLNPSVVEQRVEKLERSWYLHKYKARNSNKSDEWGLL